MKKTFIFIILLGLISDLYAQKTGLFESLINLPNDSSTIDLGNSKTFELIRTQAITTIKTDEITQSSSFSVLDALWGVSPTGIRGDKYEKLLIVDGFPRSWEYLSKQSIESISILKDAAGKALWGARGANGVIVVTTKKGMYNDKSLELEYTHGIGIPVHIPQMANASAYVRAVNEALYYDGLPLRYSNDDINQFASGQGDADIYPNVNWQDVGMQNNTSNNQLNVTARGGGENIRYFSSTNYRNNFGILNPEYTSIDNRYSSQIRSYRLSTQMNLDFDITKSTLLKMNLLGLLSENISPNISNTQIFGSFINVPSAAFPVRTQNDFWGGDLIHQVNPIGEFAATGNSKINQRMLQADFTINQELYSLLPGLSAEVSIAYDNSVSYAENQLKDYIYEVNLMNFGVKASTQYGDESNIEYDSSLDDQFMQTGLKAKLIYNKNFEDDHSLNSSITYGQESFVGLGRNNTFKRQYVMGNFGYNIQNKYLLDAVLNYYGTNVLTEGSRFTLYPAISTAWVLSNEPFFECGLVDFMKIRMSVGQSGLDNIPHELAKQFWINGTTYYFRDANNSSGGTKEGALPASNLKNERSTEGNFGVDLQLNRKLTINADIFYKRKDNIRVDGSSAYSSVLGINVPTVFEGINDTKGGEISITWQDKKQDFSYYLQGNLTYARTEIIENNEGFQPYDYLYKKGYPFGQFFGLEAIGYFNDLEDIEANPKQMFSEVRPGDIKYKDQNNDGLINQYDERAIGYSTYMPEIFYGLKMGFSYKNFGMDMIWQGVTNYSIVLNTPSVYWPLRNNTNISNWYLVDKVRWTETTKEIANLPRLTTLDNPNNFRNSTQWLEDGSYLTLKNLHLYYNISLAESKVLGMSNLQLFLKGNNLLHFDKVKYLTSENLSVGYPNLRSFHAGFRIHF